VKSENLLLNPSLKNKDTVGSGAALFKKNGFTFRFGDTIHGSNDEAIGEGPGRPGQAVLCLLGADQPLSQPHLKNQGTYSQPRKKVTI
jgi:hypothetical protein